MIDSQISAADAQRPIYAGIDVGGTNIKFGLVDDNGLVILEEKIPTESDNGLPDAIKRMAAQLVKITADAGLTMDDIAAVGLATPGTMDIAAGMILEPYNLPAWRNFPIRDELSKATGKPVTYANDAGAAGFGEYWVGCGADFGSTVLVTLGTGVGAGIIVGDMSIDGEHSHGAECGHNIIDIGDDARACTCGQTGHLEAYCSATAMVKRGTELLAGGEESSMRARVDAGEALTTLMMAEEAEKGDKLALQLIEEAATYLGIGLVTIGHTIDPSAIVLGGAVNFGGPGSELGRKFLGWVTAEFKKRAMPVLAEKTVIDFATLGGDAGYIGAAGLARISHRKSSGSA